MCRFTSRLGIAAWVFTALGCPLGYGQAVTAKLISYQATITEYCDQHNNSQKSTDTVAPIKISKSPFPCQDSSQIASVNGQLVPNLPTSISGTLQSGYFTSSPPATASVDLQADLVTGSQGAENTRDYATLSVGPESLDSRASLPPNTTTHLKATSSGTISGSVGSDSTFLITGYGQLETKNILVGNSGFYGGYSISFSAKYQVSQPTGGSVHVTSLDQKLAAEDTSIRLNIHGSGFIAGSKVEFLDENGDVDPALTVSAVTIVSASEIQALLSVGSNVLLFSDAAKTLRVTNAGGSATLPNALTITNLKLAVAHGNLTGPTAVRIANHPTIIRAGAEAASGPGLVNGVSGLLYIFKGESQIAGSPFVPNTPTRPDLNSNLLHPNNSFPNDDHFFLRDKLNFYFGMGPSLATYPALGEGSYAFLLVISPTDPSKPPPPLADISRTALKARRDFIVADPLLDQKFVSTRLLRIVLVTDPRLPAEAAAALVNAHRRDTEYFRAAYPIDGSPAKLLIKPKLGAKALDLDALKPANGDPEIWRTNVLDKLTDLLSRANAHRAPDQQFDRILLLLNPTEVEKIVAAKGVGRRPGTACIIGSPDDNTFSHELGHTFGLYDEYARANPPPDNPPNPNPRRADATANGNFVEGTVERVARLIKDDTIYPVVTAVVDADGEAVPGIPYRAATLMSSGRNRWPDLTERKYLYAKLGAAAGGAQSFSVNAPSVASEIIYVQGVIDINDKVTVTGLRRATLSLPEHDNGAFVLELLDGSGHALSATSFGIDFDLPDVGLQNVAMFSVGTPFVGGATTVRIRKDNKVLFARSISGHPPSVEILKPSGGESISGAFTISWSASDPDGDPLTYSVVYLGDDGVPVPIADKLTTKSFQWSNPQAAGGSANGHIMVVASDGVNEGSALSASFKVVNTGPTVTITEPKTGAAITAGAPVTLAGSGFDPQDGYVASSSLSFRSNIDGNLGKGESVTTKLSPGTHTITLRGVDTHGLAAETSITVVAGTAASTPSVDSVSPASARSGSSVTLHGHNFASGATVRFGTTAAQVLSVNSTQIVAVVPPGLIVGETQIFVTSGGLNTRGITFDVAYGRPLLLNLTPGKGPPGTPVFVGGSEFATSVTGNIVRFGNVTATVLNAGLDGALVSVPKGLPAGGTNVTVATNQGTSDPLPFTVTTGDPATPVVLHSLTPTSTAPNRIVTISGKGFNTTPTDNVVRFGNVVATPISAAPDSLQVAVPFGMPPGGVNVVVTVNSYPSNPLPFNVATPTPTPGPGLPGCVGPPGNLISWWDAEGDANDVKGTNPGTLQGGATANASGKVGHAFTFNGNGAYVSLGNPATLNLTGSISIEGWINPSAGPGNNSLAAIMTKWAQNVGTGPSPDAYGLWIVNRNGTFKLFSALHKAGGGTEPNIEGGVIPLNTWSHVAMTFDVSNGQYTIYINGTAVATVSSPGNNIASNNNVSIGREESYLSRYFTGRIDELSIYSRALSATEIQAIYSAGASGKCNGSTGSPALAQLQNISTRLQVGAGESLTIGGFIVVGSGAKPVIVRALGPSLTKAGITGALSDPTLSLVNGSGEVLAVNDDWVDSAAALTIKKTLPPSSASESTIIGTVAPGAYTALLRGYNDTTGVGLVELYDLDQGTPARLANISTRGYVGQDASVLIGGFIVGKEGRFVVRAIGPSLRNAGIGNALADPVLDLYNAQGVALASNDNWQSNQKAELIATTIPPTNDLEAALVKTLPPGNYTAIVRGKNNATGIGLVEIYNLQ